MFLDVRGVEVNVNRKSNNETLQPPVNLELTVVSSNLDKRKGSIQHSKVLVTSNDQEGTKTFPSVLLTFNEKFIKIGEKPQDMREKSARVFWFRDRSDSMDSSEV